MPHEGCIRGQKVEWVFVVLSGLGLSVPNITKLSARREQLETYNVATPHPLTSCSSSLKGLSELPGSAQSSGQQVPPVPAKDTA